MPTPKSKCPSVVDSLEINAIITLENVKIEVKKMILGNY
jgi:hypothetical protein